MRVSKESLPGSRVELTVQLDQQDVDRLYDRVYQEVSGRGAIRGFRPGKAPRAIIRRQVGADALRGAAWGQFVQEKLPGIMEEAELEPIETPELPELDDIRLDEGAATEIKLTLTVRPRPKLPELVGIKLLRPVAEVTEERIQERLDELRDAYAEEVPAGRDVVHEGDIVEATVRVIVEGQGGVPQERIESIAVGAREYDPPIDEALIGHRVGETVSAQKTLPDDYEDEALRGKSVVVEADIEAVMVKQLPELTDEFARMVDAESYQSLEDLREGIRRQLVAQDEKVQRASLEAQVLDYVNSRTQLDLPASLVRAATVEETGAYLRRLETEGMPAHVLDELATLSEQELQASFMDRARARLRDEFIIAALLEATGVEATDEAMEAELARYVAEGELDEDLVRQAVDIQDSLRDTLSVRARVRLMLDKIIADAEIEDVPAEGLGARLAALRAEEAAFLEAERAAGGPAAATEALAEGAGEQPDGPAASIEGDGDLSGGSQAEAAEAQSAPDAAPAEGSEDVPC